MLLHLCFNRGRAGIKDALFSLRGQGEEGLCWPSVKLSGTSAATFGGIPADTTSPWRSLKWSRSSSPRRGNKGFDSERKGF